MNLEQLGFNGHQLEQIDRMIRCPFGVILVTGSVGSGKTTTLYSMLKVINTPSKNIITLEEPVEHTIPGINQIQINPKAGLTYVTGIRSILRQDPNIIMVGEIRDPDTAGMVIRAALSGHLVFSTLHTNRAAGTVSRLLDMGVEPYLLASCLVGVISQTLVRKICPHCKVAYLPSQEEKECLGLVRHNSTFWRGKGCELCNYTGFKGRIAVGEIIRISDAYRELIMKRATPREIDRVSQKLGVFGLKESGVELVREGITTTDEILRVVYYEN
jgi:type IV pilus assembly protein PilB